jgi:hypothetical protein
VNRNIVTEQDAGGSVEESLSADGVAATLPRPDDYMDRLLKYLPAEVGGAYLIIAGLIGSGLAERPRVLQVLLAVLLVLGIAASWLFASRTLHVRRTQQLAMTALAFVVWVSATGGWFATLSWWEAWMGTIFVVVFGFLVRLVPVPPLPPDSVGPAGAAPSS